MIDTPPSPRVAVHSSRPSGDRSMPSGLSPGTGISVIRARAGPAMTSSTIVTVLEPVLGMNIAPRSRSSTSMCVPSSPIPSVQSMASADGS